MKNLLFIKNLKTGREFYQTIQQSKNVKLKLKAASNNAKIPDTVGTLSLSYCILKIEKNLILIEYLKDWRVKGCVLPVKNSGGFMCHSSYAVLTAESLAGMVCVAGHPLVELSGQQILDCSQSFGNNGCEFGSPLNSFNYLNSTAGLDPEQSYPFEDTVGQCRFKPETVAARISDFKEIEPGNENDLTLALATYGPIAVGIDASQFSFQFYQSGIYYDANCSSTEIDFMIILVG